jgi:hypothetical protein
MKAILAVVGLSLGTVLAYSVLLTTAVPDDSEVKRLIAELDHEDFERRERADEALLAKGEAARAQLVKALAGQPSAESRLRADRILQQLDSQRLAGALKLELKTDRVKLKVGDEIKLKSTIHNTTDEDVNLYVGRNPVGVGFECGSVLTRLSDDGNAEGAASFSPTYLCGHRMGPVFMTLAPRSKLEYTMPAKLERRKNEMLQLNLGANRYFQLDAPDQGKQRLRLVHTVSDHNNLETGFNGGGRRPTNEQARFWTGVLRSNDIEIEVIPTQE